MASVEDLLLIMREMYDKYRQMQSWPGVGPYPIVSSDIRLIADIHKRMGECILELQDQYEVDNDQVV